MGYGLISLFPLQLARIVGLVRRIEPVQLADDPRDWVLIVRGRGFTRILRDEPLVAPNLIRPTGWNAPRPMVFRRLTEAEAYARYVGLMPQQRSWAVRNGSNKAKSE